MTSIMLGTAILLAIQIICILKANRSKEDHQKKFARRTTT